MVNYADMQVDQALTDQMMDKAIRHAPISTLTEIRADPSVHAPGTLRYLRTVSECLVRQIGDYLGQVDRTVKAVYHYEPQEGSLQAAGKTMASRPARPVSTWPSGWNAKVPP